MNYCFPKSGDSSKPSISYRVYAMLQTMCSRRVQLVLASMAAFVVVLASFYFYLDGLYIVDEVLQGNRLREYTLKEKVTIRVVAPRSNEDLSKFVLEHSICQAVHEIQIVWPHQQPRPLDSFFKYPHTHSKVKFIEASDNSAWDTLYGGVQAETESVLLLDADVVVPCASLAFAQTVWRSSGDALVGFFPRLLEWTVEGPADKSSDVAAAAPAVTAVKAVSVLGWGSVAWRGQYSLMLPAGLLLRREYLETMNVPATGTGSGSSAASAVAALRSYVDAHAHCADLALPLWAAHLGSLGQARQGTSLNVFPPVSAPPPIWVDLPGLSLRPGVQLSAYPAAGGAAERAALMPAKAKLTPEQSDACATDIVRLLLLTPEKVPVATFKSTLASTHMVW